MNGLSGATVLEHGEETHRLSLSRNWDYEKPMLGFVMLNPSVADHDKDDPTIRRCIGFAKDKGYGGIAVFNLYTLVSTDPKALYSTANHPAADAELRSLEDWDMETVVFGCGVQKVPGIDIRIRQVYNLLIEAGKNVVCLGKTKAGYPRHPLFMPKNSPLFEWSPDELD